MNSNVFQDTKIPEEFDSDEKSGNLLGAVATTWWSQDVQIGQGLQSRSMTSVAFPAVARQGSLRGRQIHSAARGPAANG
jgi:hypothetical protein